ncbi:MAG TPA: cytochrome c [Kofleriaceae bacterium]|nr:cytochrome c [Kofleriaceae bacterium]
MTYHALRLGFALFLVSACSNSGGGDSSSSGSASGDQAAAAAAITPQEAQATFTQRCSACHGNEGRGDGPGSTALNPKPRNFHDTYWQKTVTDEQIENTIKVGGAAVGKSPAMPAHPDLGGKPEVLAGLRGVIRNFGKN